MCAPSRARAQVFTLESAASGLKSQLALREEELTSAKSKLSAVEAQRQLLASEVDKLRADVLTLSEGSSRAAPAGGSLDAQFALTYVAVEVGWCVLRSGGGPWRGVRAAVSAPSGSRLVRQLPLLTVDSRGRLFTCKRDAAPFPPPPNFRLLLPSPARAACCNPACLPSA